MTLKTALLAGGASCAAAIAGFSLPSFTDRGVPFLDPVMMMRSMCGTDVGGALSRRAFFLSAAAAYADEIGAASGPLLAPETLAAISYPSGSAVDGVQQAFDEGLAYTFGFNHGAGIGAFQKAQKLDPDCALCYWGEAFALGSNINQPMVEEAHAPAMLAAKRALERAEPGTKEEALAKALSVRYIEKTDDGLMEDHAAFADAMDELAQAYPDDDFIAVIAAEANMDTQPWDYWELNGREQKGRTARTLELIEGVLARNPGYPPAIHLYIHITEASSDPYRAEPYADQLAGLTPDLGHLVHMPTHTYYRLGRWEKTRDLNIEAVAVDEAFINEADDESPMYAFGYYPHNVHFAMTAAQMAGDRETALSMAEKLDAAVPAEMVALVPFMQAIKASPYFTAAQFAEPDIVLAQPAPGAEFPYLMAAWHYARGEALAKTGAADDALAEADAIAALVDHKVIAALEEQFMPARSVLLIAEHTVRARALASEGKLKEAIALMETAAELQAKMPYMEPPWWYYPSEQTLAGLLLQDGQAERAMTMFQKTLLKSPNNAYALFGLREAYKAMDDRPGARYADRLYRDAWLGKKSLKPEIAEL